jgi:hypothetical protein
MRKAVLALLLVLLGVVASGQNNDKACPYGKGPPPQCFPGSHPVVECICDGPAGPCHWVWHCVPNN